MPSAKRRGRSVVTLHDALRAAERRLTAAAVCYGHGTTNARDEAAWLALHALGLPFEALEARLTKPLGAAERRTIEAIVDVRIATRKPAAYLTNEAWLGEHRFYVDERVIVPRSFIAELLRERRRRALGRLSAVRRALDLCTGSGCLAIILALTCKHSTVDAADISPAALEVARRNVQDYGLPERVKLIESDLFSGLGAARYDLIVSNPPYVRDAVMRRLPPEYRREPALALAGGADGLDLVRRIVAEAPHHLAPGGLLVMEVGHARARVERAFPALSLAWPQTSGGDDCVFTATREALVRARAPARARRATSEAA